MCSVLPIVQKGKFAAWAASEPTKALNNVLFPTFGSPTMPQFRLMDMVNWKGLRARAGTRRCNTPPSGLIDENIRPDTENKKLMISRIQYCMKCVFTNKVMDVGNLLNPKSTRWV